MSLPDHLAKPQIRPLLGQDAAFGLGANVACGDELRVEVALGPGGLLKVGYSVRGCSALVATASLCMSLIEGLSLEQARNFDVDAAIAQAGGLDRRGAHAARVFGRAFEGALAGLA